MAWSGWEALYYGGDGQDHSRVYIHNHVCVLQRHRVLMGDRQGRHVTKEERDHPLKAWKEQLSTDVSSEKGGM